MINKEIMLPWTSPGRGWRVVCETETWVYTTVGFLIKPESGWIYPRHWGRNNIKRALSHEYLSYVISE